MPQIDVKVVREWVLSFDVLDVENTLGAFLDLNCTLNGLISIKGSSEDCKRTDLNSGITFSFAGQTRTV